MTLQTPDIIKPLVIGRDVLAEQNRVGTEVDRPQRHSAINSRKLPDAFRPFHHVAAEVRRENCAVGALRAAELLSWGDFDRRFAGHVGYKEVERNVFAVHVFINPRLDVAWHSIGVQVAVILQHILTQV